jgi:restriction endonuclease S subunit
MMESYSVSQIFDKNRVFILWKSEIESRFDPFYYVPEIVALEKKVLSKKPKKLREFVKYIASGATPKTTESEKYYANQEDGIPFLRVQNLTPSGELQLEDFKYINKETHQGMLKRSQVAAGDLLVKITGVGRMAVASVVPEEFEGNINQHVCVIRTGYKEVSEILAAYLNSDTGEKLASRRSTGGTRPALDYPALLSIPIIEDKRILEISRKVVLQKKQYEAEAEKLLASADDYLLKELGIVLPEQSENTLKNRMFMISRRNISDKRLDPRFHKNFYFQFYLNINKKFPTYKLKDITEYIGSGSTPYAGGEAYTSKEDGIPFIRITNLKYDTIDLKDVLYIKKDVHETYLKRTQLRAGDLLLSMAGTIGLTVIVPDFIHGANINQAIARIVLKSGFNNIYIKELLNSVVGKIQTERLSRPSVQANINLEEIGSLLIPMPSVEKQIQIANQINTIKIEAKDLKNKANEVMESARKEIEGILLSNP